MIMLIYPPTGELYQRGEDRCQINVSKSTANTIRACNDLGYISATLTPRHKVFLKDYQGEKLTVEDLLGDVKAQNPDFIFISTTNGSIFRDLEIIKKIKSVKSDVIVLLKGSLFFNLEADALNKMAENLDGLDNADYLIFGESEFIVAPLLNAHFNGGLENIQGIACKKNGKWTPNPVTSWCEDVDSLPFPDRYKMNNALYINPETDEPMATITTSRGCPFSCIYCLSPKISGKKNRKRSPENIFQELQDCVQNHNITNFFFRSDTFTTDKNQVLELCRLINESGLKINWVATSRVDTINEEMLKEMKRAGCSMLAIGFESGSDESLKKMKKNITAEQNLQAAKLCKSAGIKIFGYYLMGLPWETKQHLKETEDLIFKTDADFIEVSIIVPYKHTELYDMTIGKLHDENVLLGKDSYKDPQVGTEFVSHKELDRFRKEILRKYYLRPSYIFKTLTQKGLKPSTLLHYIKYGLKMLKNTIM